MTKNSSLIILLSAFILLSFFACSSSKKVDNKEQLVLIETNMGNIKVKLYNQTPLHRDNFIKLVDERFYNGVLFHRVIDNFMIQAGDPDSRSTKGGEQLGSGDVDYTIIAEIQPEFFHKKGALAAARQGDQVNPEKKSSGAQFYIVEGQTLTDEDFDQIENRINSMSKKGTFFKFVEEEKDRAMENDSVFDYSKIQQEAALKTEEVFANTEPYKISEEHREVYKTIGGTPHLDQNYTVFGEVVEGLDVVEKIAEVKTDQGDRPVENVIVISMKTVRK
ncbi:MAG: peptidylprolyl isomerase [Bacteroidales bacterium]|nr:peptidylprolyl isomerase [Bacteroidales bacterium]